MQKLSKIIAEKEQGKVIRREDLQQRLSSLPIWMQPLISALVGKCQRFGQGKCERRVVGRAGAEADDYRDSDWTDHRRRLFICCTSTCTLNIRGISLPAISPGFTEDSHEKLS